MIRKFKLTGLSKPKTASIERLNNKSEEKIDIPVGLSDESFSSLFDYVKNFWSDGYIALVKCDGLNEDQWPVNPILAGIENS